APQLGLELGGSELRRRSAEDANLAAGVVTASLVELSDHRPDDIAVIIGPHPLVRIRWLEHPIARVCEGPENLLAPHHRCNGTDEFVWIGRLVQVHLVADQCHAAVGCRDPRDYRSELEVPV